MGSVETFPFPLTLPGDWMEYKLHGDAVTQIRLSPDNQRLITGGKDGSLCIWKVNIAQEPSAKDNQRYRGATTVATSNKFDTIFEHNRIIFDKN